MSADLEKQLQASLPGRPTEVQDYAALHRADARLRLAIELLHQAAAEIRVAAGNQRPAALRAEEAELATRRAVHDVEIAIKAHPAGRQR